MSTRQLVLSALAAAAMTAACSKGGAAWSGPRVLKDGSTRSVATVGLALMLGKSGQVEMVFGSDGTVFADETTATTADLQTAGVLPVGRWILSKGNVRMTLPNDGHGLVKTYGLYENTHPEIWQLLTAPGCATLTTVQSAEARIDSSVVEKTYELCDVDKAVARLRSA